MPESYKTDEGNWAKLANIPFIRDQPINNDLTLQILKKRENLVIQIIKKNNSKPNQSKKFEERQVTAKSTAMLAGMLGKAGAGEVSNINDEHVDTNTLSV